MKPKFYIGTSGWMYNHWRGRFYPEGLSRNHWLEFFQKHFNTVEINASFYRVPFENLVKSWVKKAPPDFKYSYKLHRKLTHVKKLIPDPDFYKFYWERMKPLLPLTGFLLIQLPPSLKKDLPRTEEFLAMIREISPDVPLALEFRHRSWISDDVFEFAKKHNIVLCGVSSPIFEFMAPAGFEKVYFRFHGASRWYSYLYSLNELKKYAEAFLKLEAKEYYIYFNNDPNAWAVKNAKELCQILQI